MTTEKMARTEAGAGARQLGLLDIVGLTVGAIVGADIYVASAFGAGRLGPASLVVWALAGLLALVIALTFAQCAMYVPKVGGPYAYVAAAYGQLPGFLVGWTLWIAEWTSLAVFPIAFARYLGVLFPGLSPLEIALAKTAFISFVLLTNLYGARLAGTVNDLLTVFKLAPLALLTLLGLFLVILDPGVVQAHLTPFAPLGWTAGVGDTLVLIFWAYAGFELATIPAGEVRQPTRTVPVAITVGMAVVTLFYILTNFVLLAATPWSELARAAAPLTLGFQRVLGEIAPAFVAAGGLLMTIGAIVSIAGSNESGVLGTSRLAYAMAADGHLPKAFARLHPRYQTPYVALLFQSGTALIAALVGTLGLLIRVTVFSLGLAYLLTSLAAIKLARPLPRRRQTTELPPARGLEASVPSRSLPSEPLPAVAAGALGRRPWVRWGMAVVPYLSALASLFLLSQVGFTPAVLGMAMLGVGLLVYTYLSPEQELKQLKAWLVSRRYQYGKVAAISQRFLAWPLSIWRRRFWPQPAAPGWAAEPARSSNYRLTPPHPAAEPEIGEIGQIGQIGQIGGNKGLAGAGETGAWETRTSAPRRPHLGPAPLFVGLLAVVALVGFVAATLGDRTPSPQGQRGLPQAVAEQGRQIASASESAQLAAWAQPYAERGIPVLYYHQVSDLGPASGLRVPVAEFRRQMEFLYTHGYQVISLDDLVYHLWPSLASNGPSQERLTRAPASPIGADIGAKPIVITFDDGYLDVYTNAIPILQELGYTATIFVTPYRPWGQPLYLQTVPYMNVRHWRQLAAAGFTIGSHTLTHHTLTKIPIEQARHEIADSRRELERLLGQPVRYFAYPRGRFNDALMTEAERAGYVVALTTKRGVNTPTTPRFALRRLPVVGTMSLDEFARELERFTAALPVPLGRSGSSEQATPGAPARGVGSE